MNQAITSAEDCKTGQIILIDKPLHWTSFRVVSKVRGLLRSHFQIDRLKVGHAGTLDPLATGLLVLCTGKATKGISEIQAAEKEYIGRICLGATTPSYDLETEIDHVYPYSHINRNRLEKAVNALTGEILQSPPVFSAIKKDGVRMYKIARQGLAEPLAGRPIYIREFEITGFELPEVDFRIICSKGTYIRSIAHDLGKLLESGGHLSSLRRTRIGTYHVNGALSFENFQRQITEICDI